ncbi:unnamed protein product [Echinostoma caproni]|uniref:PDCD2_C domain-containing protein n=1 Tax=Echinostoma caproni TaxID=27848 RepID=A0A183AAB3_9TREM|nr:unnamed protein product [Echinostoma caproni]
MALLGFASKPVGLDPPGSCDSYVGGSLIHFENVTPALDLRACPSCHTVMCFIGHIYCPLSDSPYHRVLCLFVCLKRDCQEKGLSWRALRSQHMETAQSKQSKPDSQWCLPRDDEETKEDDWGDEQEEEVYCEELTKQPESIVLKGPFVCCHVDVYEEGLDTGGEESMNEDKLSTGSVDSSNFAAWSRADAVEREFIEEDDNAIPNAFSGGLELHLATRGEHGCEEIRYWWSGRPVFNGPPPKELATRLKCTRCGANRVFELQLFPTLNNRLSLLPTIEQTDDERVDFQLPEPDQIDKDWLLRITTVLLFTCSSSCWTDGDGWVEECIVVQTDTDRTCVWDGSTPAFSGETM